MNIYFSVKNEKYNLMISMFTILLIHRNFILLENEMGMITGFMFLFSVFHLNNFLVI